MSTALPRRIRSTASRRSKASWGGSETEDGMTEAEDTIALIATLLRKGEAFCVATVVRTEHATSAKAGAKAVILADGTIKGFLGGGCVQRAIRRTSEAVLKEGRPRLIR